MTGGRTTARQGVAILLALAALVACGGPKRAIRRQLEALAGSLDKEGPEEPLAAAGAARRAAALFAEGVVVRAAPYERELRGRQAVAGAILRWRATTRSLSVRFEKEALEVAADGAAARLDATVKVASGHGPGRGREAYRVRMEWVLEGADWLIHRVELVEVLEPSPLGL